MDTTGHKMASSSSMAVMADVVPSSKINSQEFSAASSVEEVAAAARVASGSFTRRKKKSPKKQVKNAKPPAASHSKAKRSKRSHSDCAREKSKMNYHTEDNNGDNERGGVVPEVAQSASVCGENNVVDLSGEFSNSDQTYNTSSDDDDDSDDEYIFEKSNSKLNRGRKKRNVLPADKTDQTELWIARLNYGQCPKCGIQTHTIDGGSRLPITDEDVRKGRCLLCNPLPASHSRSSPLPSIVPPSLKPTSASVTRSASTAPVSSPPDVRCDTAATMEPAPVDPVPKTPLTRTVPTPHELQPSRASGKRFRDTFDYGWGDYTGEIDDSGKRYGRGIMKWDSGEEYDGEWQGNKMHGKGIIRLMWKNGKKIGRGIQRSSADGDVYEGEWKSNMWYGKGIRRSYDGRVDIQLYKNGSPIGDGVRWSADRQTAWRVKGREGKLDKITLKAAAAIASRIGLPVPLSRIASKL